MLLIRFYGVYNTYINACNNFLGSQFGIDDGLHPELKVLGQLLVFRKGGCRGLAGKFQIAEEMLIELQRPLH